MADINVSDFVVPVNERYYGKTKDLIKLENTISQYRHKYLTGEPSKFVSWSNFEGAEKDPLVDSIVKQFKSIFGFKTMSFLFFATDLPSAYTVPTMFDRVPNANNNSSFIQYTKNGPKFKAKANMSIVMGISSALLFNAEFTDEEVMAAMLHEIGHHFQRYIMNECQALCIAGDIYSVLSTVIETTFHVSVIGKVLKKNLLFEKFAAAFAMVALKAFKCTKYAKEFNLSEKSNLSADAEEVFDNIKDDSIHPVLQKIVKTTMIMEPFIKTLAAVGGAFIRFKVSLVSLINKMLPNAEYNDEKIADSFASDIGYGPALASILTKINEIKPHYSAIDPWDTNPITRNMKKIILLPSELIKDSFDEHPKEFARMLSMYEDLLFDLNNGYFDPAQKAELEKQIKELRNGMRSMMLLDANIKREAVDDIVKEDLNDSANFIVSIAMGYKAGIKYGLSKIIPNYFVGDPNISRSKEKAYENNTNSKP